MDKLADRESIGNMLRKGMLHREIALATGSSISTIAKVAGELGLQTRRNKQYVKLDEDDWVDILELVKNHGVITEIAKDYGISRSAIYAKLKERK